MNVTKFKKIQKKYVQTIYKFKILLYIIVTKLKTKENKNMTSKKAERIYKMTSVTIRRFIRNYNKFEGNEELDATKYIVPLVYEDDETVSVRTLNDMMEILERKERDSYRTASDDELTIMRNSINSKMQSIREFQAFLKTL